MGDVAVLFRLMPQGVDTDLKAVGEQARTSLPKGVVIRGMQIKDIAYGLRSLLILRVIMPDAGGILDSTEQALAKLPHVESVEVMEEGLL